MTGLASPANQPLSSWRKPSAEAVDEVVVKVPELAGQVLAEGAEVRGDKRGLLFPCAGVDSEQDVQVAFSDAQAVGVKRTRGGHIADRAPDGRSLAGQPFHDPLQYPDVLTEARPEIGRASC